MITFPGEVKNIFERIYLWAEKAPDRIALVIDDGQGQPAQLSFLQVLQKTQDWRQNFRDLGFKKGDRALILVPFSVDFVFLILAAFAENIVPVLIDPRLKKSFWKKAICDAQIKGIISNQKILKWRWLFFWIMKFRLYSLDGPGFRVASFFSREGKKSPQNDWLQPTVTEEEEEVLVTLTSGTTSEPKLVTRSFSVIKSQQVLICKYLPQLQPDIHLSLYGIGVLQSLVEGATTIFTLDHTAKNISSLIPQHQVSRLSGPPVAINQFLQQIEAEKTDLKTLKNIITGGAPIPRWLAQKALLLLPNLNFDILYGSTECEPISYQRVTSKDLESPLDGYLVGTVIPELQLIKKDFTEVLGHKIFEVCLKGPNCVNSAGEDHLSTGDLAYLNDQQQLVLVGRLKEVIEKIPVGLIEERLERLGFLSRSALVAKGRTVQLHIELGSKSSQLTESQTQLIQAILLEFGFQDVQIQVHEKIPVDPRHGWKIQRSFL